MQKRDLKVIGWLLLIILSIYGLNKAAFFFKLKSSLQIDTVPDGLLNYGTVGKILKRLSLVKAIPNDSKRFPITVSQKKERFSENTLIKIIIETDTKTIFKIYWAKEGQKFSEHRSSKVRITPAIGQYQILIPHLSNIRKLRIDPANGDAGIKFYSMIIEKEGYKPIIFNNMEKFKLLKPLTGIKNISYSPTRMSFNTIGKDPQLGLRIDPVIEIEKAIFQRKRHVGEYIYEANPGKLKAFPSSIVIKPEYFKKNWPLLSIVTEDSNLYHPDSGIITNKTSRGRGWERPAYISYFESGKLRYAGMAGIRMHGGKVRLQMYNNFRLYFRKEYGAGEFHPGILFGSKTEPLKRLVVRNTSWPPGWPFNNPLAYDIVRQIGAIAPETQLTVLYLNGIFDGIYFLTPHLSRTQLKSYFGHDNFDLYLFKKKNTADAKAFHIKNFWRYTNSRKRLIMDDVGKIIDLDNLTRHLFSFAFSGTTDYCQGAAVQDNSKKDGKLFWINWDMDHSFIDISQTFFKKNKKKKEIWEQIGWSLVYNKKRRHCGRVRLFTRLVNEDPAFRERVITLTMDLLNHRVNKRFLNDRLQFYGNLLSSYGEKNSLYIKKLDQFFQNRPFFLRKEMQELFGIGEIVRSEVNGPRHIRYEIDGYPEPDGYIGYYRKGKQIRIKIKNIKQGKFSHWLINEKKVLDYPLIYTLNQKTNIRAVFSDL